MKNNFNVVAYDVNAETLKTLQSEGANIASSPQEVAENARKIVSMVPASAHVKEVYCGTNGVLKAAQSGDVYIDASTIDPHVAKEVSALVATTGASMLDTPVSGGVTGAANGTLTFMVGGSEETLEKARSMLEAMGKKITYCGPNGCGQVVKVCFLDIM